MSEANEYENRLLRRGAEDTPLGRLMHDFACADPDKMSYKIFADKIGEQKRNKEKVKKLAGVMEEIANQVRRETASRVRRETTVENMINTAKKMLTESELSIEKIASICELPFEKVQELKESISVQTKGTI